MSCFACTFITRIRKLSVSTQHRLSEWTHTQWSSDPFHYIIIRHELLPVWIKKIAYLIITFNDDNSVFSCFSVDSILSNNNICHYYCSLVLILTLKTKTAEKPKLNWLLLEFEMGRSQRSTVHDSKNLLQMIKFIRKQSWSYIKLEERMLGIVKHMSWALVQMD